MDSTKPRISIVVPVYRSATILPKLMARLTSTLERDTHEIILVNDCSPDESWTVIKDLSKQYPALKGINLRRNVGQHNAIMAGLNYATGQVIVTLDDDLQHAPEDMHRLVAKVDEGYDVCYSKFGERHHSWWKVLGSRFNDWLAGILLEKPAGLYLSPFRAMSYAVRTEIIRYSGPSTYVDGLILSVTSNIASVDVTHHQRADGEKGSYSVRKSISLLLKMSTISSILPLRLATLTGFIIAGFGVLLALFLVLQRFIWNAMPLGWSSIVVASLLLGGVQLMALGIVGEYVGRIFLEIRRRPQYTVAATTDGAHAPEERAAEPASQRRA